MSCGELEVRFQLFLTSAHNEVIGEFTQVITHVTVEEECGRAQEATWTC